MFTLETTATAAYVVAAILFILALAGLSKHETSRAGNTFGIAGMAVALIATIALAFARHIEPLGVALLFGAMAIGATIGLWRAKVVEMTGMPELIALLHSFVGLAAVLVGWNGYLHVERDLAGSEAALLHHEGMLGIRDLVGGRAADLTYALEHIVHSMDVGFAQQSAIGVDRK